MNYVRSYSYRGVGFLYTQLQATECLCPVAKEELEFPGLWVTHSPAASIGVHVTVHLQGRAGVTVQVDGVQATGDVAVLLNLAAV